MGNCGALKGYLVVVHEGILSTLLNGPLEETNQFTSSGSVGRVVGSVRIGKFAETVCIVEGDLCVVDAHNPLVDTLLPVCTTAHVTKFVNSCLQQCEV